MKLCKQCENEGICDFCLFHCFNGEELKGRMVYTGKGYCMKTRERRDPGDCACDDFECEFIGIYGEKGSNGD